MWILYISQFYTKVFRKNSKIEDICSYYNEDTKILISCFDRPKIIHTIEYIWQYWQLCMENVSYFKVFHRTWIGWFFHRMCWLLIWALLYMFTYKILPTYIFTYTLSYIIVYTNTVQTQTNSYKLHLSKYTCNLVITSVQKKKIVDLIVVILQTTVLLIALLTQQRHWKHFLIQLYILFLKMHIQYH